MTTSQIDYSRKWYVMAAVAMGTLLATIDSSIVNIALPTLVKEFNADLPIVQWVVLAYLLTLATLLMSVGRLADMIGKKPIYTFGFAVFTVGSFLCGLATSIYLLILFRVIQAIGATMILALGIAIVTEAFPTNERGKAIGISGTMVSIGIILGPTLGGIIIDLLSWNWIFFVNLPIGIIGILLVFRYVPEIKPVGKQRFDFFGASTLFLCILTFLMAVTLGQNYKFSNPLIIILFVISGLLLIGFILLELFVKQPMIDLKLFRNVLFSINLVTGYLTFFAIAGTTILMPFYLENVLEFNTREVGLLMAAVPISMGIVAPLAGSVSDRYGTRLITVIGLGILLVGYSSLSTLTSQTSTIGYLLRFLPIGIGMGVFQSPNNSAIMGAAPRGRLGIVSGMLAVNRALGQTTGIAILGAVWTASVISYAYPLTIKSATVAPAPAQVNALRDTLIVITVTIFIALGLGLLAFIKERRSRSLTESNQNK